MKCIATRRLYLRAFEITELSSRIDRVLMETFITDGECAMLSSEGQLFS